MNSEWQTYLTNQNLTERDLPAAFLKSETTELQITPKSDALIDLSHFGLVKITGEENKKFLQGQLTCDAEAIDESHSVLGAYCNLKGRAHVSFRAFQRDQDIYLVMDRDLVEPFINTLNKYIVFSKAEMSDASDELVLLGLKGSNAANTIGDLVGSELTQPHNTASKDETQAICHHNYPAPLYIIVTTPNEAINLQEKLESSTPLIGFNAWDLMLIEAGFAEIKAAATELFIPLEINQQDLGFINFEKGCYTGQEIIARLHYRGKAKQRLFIASVSTEQLPAINDPIILTDKPDAQPAGHVVNAAWKGQNQAAIIAVIKNQFALTENLQLSSSKGAKLKVTEVPYAITNEEDD